MIKNFEGKGSESSNIFWCLSRKMQAGKDLYFSPQTTNTDRRLSMGFVYDMLQDVKDSTIVPSNTRERIPRPTIDNNEKKQRLD